MFNPAKFAISVGVANIHHHQDKMVYLPNYITQASEFTGFQELAQLLPQNSVIDDSMGARRSYAG